MDDSLPCQEKETWLDEECSFIQSQSQSQSQQDYGVSEDEHVGILFEREIRFGFKMDQTLTLEDWVQRARKDAINWILKTRAALGFRFQTAYLSVTYLDRFLSRRSIDIEKHWAIQLLSLACLSLAAKMEECNVPWLSHFQLQDYCFESKVVQRMELLVLATLDWNMGIITPFAFLPCFITKLCKTSPQTHIFSDTMQLIFITMKEVNLMHHKPSVIAIAAILVALDHQLTIDAVELKISSIPQLELKDIFACYNLIERLYVGKTRRDKLLHTPNPSPIQSKPVDTAERSLLTCAPTTKRRRLTFSDDDHESRDGRGSDSTRQNPNL